MSVNKILLLVLLFFSLNNTVEPELTLTCDKAYYLLQHFFRTHISEKEFTDKLKKLSRDNLIKLLDPSGVNFYPQDLEKIHKSFENLPKDLKAGNCQAVTLAHEIFQARLREQKPIIEKLIKTKHDFSVDEYWVVDPDLRQRPKNKQELTEYLRQRVKFQLKRLLEDSADGKAEKEKKGLSKSEWAVKKLSKRYELFFKKQEAVKPVEALGNLLKVIASSMDPHSAYLDDRMMKKFRMDTGLSLDGIGALLSSRYSQEREAFVVTVQRIIPGGAADKGKQLKVGDRIIAVAQAKDAFVDIVDMDLEEVVQLIRGPRKTKVRLTVERGLDSKRLVIPIIREKIELEDQAIQVALYEVSKVRVGLITVPSFYIDFEGRQKKKDYRSSSRDFKKAIDRLKLAKAKVIVVDLTGNAGGSLDEVIDMAGALAGKSPVVQVKGKHGPPYVSRYSGAKFYDGPVILRIDRLSASASEILAAFVQDAGRGLLIGTRTYGKGTVQVLNTFPGKLGGGKITTNQFLRTSGLPVQLEGVTPDISLPEFPYDIGEDKADNPLVGQRVKGVHRPKFNLVKPYLAELARRSKQRVDSSEDFKTIKESIATYLKEKEASKKVSLKMEKPKKGKDKSEKKGVKKGAKKGDSVEKKKNKKDQEEASEEGGNVNPYIEESLFIAADYLRLLNGQKLSSKASKVKKLDLPGQKVKAK